MRKTPKLGQHFLTGLWAARKLVDAVAVQGGERILEIGPGEGALTRELLKTGASVVAIEKDPELVARLEETFAKEIHQGSLRVVEGDVRDTTPATLGLERYVVAANIPYYITGEILRRFLESARQPRALALLVQKEVAERIIARDGKESMLSLSVKAYGTPKIVAKVSRGNFSPPPSVDSSILLVQNVSRALFDDMSEKDFFSLVRAGFSSKRKMLVGNLAAYGKERVARAFTELGIEKGARAEDLLLEEWRALTRALTSRASAARAA